jgi:hypothetical protein
MVSLFLYRGNRDEDFTEFGVNLEMALIITATPTAAAITIMARVRRLILSQAEIAVSE